MREEYIKILTEYEELQRKLSDPAFLAAAIQSEIKKTGERFALLERVKKEIEIIKKADTDLAANQEILKSERNEELLELARAEKHDLEKLISEKQFAINELLYPDPDAAIKKIILEIRAGAGGDEAGIFAAELLRMYQRYAERQNWRFEIMDLSLNIAGGYKEVIAEIEGKMVYQKLHREMGVHRVQRVPATEKIGRVHTSTVSVAILPEAKDVDIDIKPQDIEVEFFRSSGPGGQNVNKVETAVRIIHKSTGTVVSSQQGRSQLKNRENAMSLLRTRLLDIKRQEEETKRAKERKEQIGTADRSEKIRTYNFPQDRVTDHRIKESWHNIQSIMAGDIETIINAFKNKK